MDRLLRATPDEDLLAARLLHHRVLVLAGELDDAAAQRLCAALLLLAAEDPHRDATLWIDSTGGSVAAGLAVHDVLRLVPHDVSTVALGVASGTAQLLLGAGTPGKRFALPHARVSVHDGTATSTGRPVGVGMPARDQLDHPPDVLVGLVAEQSRSSVGEIRRLVAARRPLTALEARDHGLVDEVLTDLQPLTPPGPARRVGLGTGTAPVGAGR